MYITYNENFEQKKLVIIHYRRSGHQIVRGIISGYGDIGTLNKRSEMSASTACEMSQKGLHAATL
jgi:hypothetical protein